MISRRGFLVASAGAVASSRLVPVPSARAAKPRAPLGPPTFHVDGDHLVARNDRLEVIFDGTSGGIRAMRNRATGQELLQTPASAPAPWKMTAQQPPPGEQQQTFSPQRFTYAIARDGHSADLRWETGQDGLTVRVRALLGDHGDLELWPKLVNERVALPPQVFTYPLLENSRTFSGNGASDYCIYPQCSTGFLYRAPFGQTIPSIDGNYPDGYSGVAMQVMGYYREGVGGFSFATHDPHSTRKVLNFSQDEISFGHATWDLRRGADLDYRYPVVVAPMTRGDWYEVAEHYRRWAITQPWCAKGPKWQRADDEYCRWVHEEVGLVVWQVPSNADWSPWLRWFREATGTPVQIVHAYDWSATRGWQMGFEGYFPPQFHPNNVAEWKHNRVTAYVNDLFISYEAQDFETKWRPATMTLNFPFDPFPADEVFAASGPTPGTSKGGAPDPRVTGDAFYFLCPVTEVQRSLHVWRDSTLVQLTHIDGVQYDISFGNPENWMTCTDSSHGHPPGAGRWVVQAFIENARRSKAAMAKALGRYPYQGTETVIETALDVVDGFYSRILAGPHTLAEGRPLQGGDPYEAPPGQGRECVPFFEAVYHDYGPVRHDGFAQLNPGYGDIFYWTAAKIVCRWGGLLELDYNIGWPEAIPGWNGTPPATYTPYDGAYYEAIDAPALDPAKAAFLREIATARTGYGNPWLGYGRLARPTGTPSKSIPLDYGNHEDINPVTRYTAQGTWDVPQLLEGAWLDSDDRLGLFFCNLAKDEDFALHVDVDAAERWGQDYRGRALTMSTSDGTKTIGAVGRDNRVRFALTLPPRRITLVSVS